MSNITQADLDLLLPAIIAKFQEVEQKKLNAEGVRNLSMDGTSVYIEQQLEGELSDTDNVRQMATKLYFNWYNNKLTDEQKMILEQYQDTIYALRNRLDILEANGGSGTGSPYTNAEYQLLDAETPYTNEQYKNL